MQKKYNSRQKHKTVGSNEKQGKGKQEGKNK